MLEYLQHFYKSLTSIFLKMILVAFLLTNLKPDFVIENKISCSIYGQSNLRLQSKQSQRGSFGLVLTEAGFRFSFRLSEIGPSYSTRFVTSAHNKLGEGNGGKTRIRRSCDVGISPSIFTNSYTSQK